MEFLVLPLLLLVGLVTSLDGGSDEDGGNGSGDENDVLTGSGTEHVYGQTGDDDLTLSDHAVGMGGDGNDTLNAVDEAVGYGLAGDDSLIGADNATIRGGEGDDWLDARDEALASGGNGNDVIFTSGDAEGSGGNGSDTMTALDESRIYGGDGTDYLSGNNQAQVYGGDGADTLSLDDRAAGYGGASDDILDAAGQNQLTGGLGSDHFVANPDRAGADGPADLTVTDYDAGEDQLAVLLGQSDTSGLTMTLGRTEDNSGTVIEITDEADALVARFTLEGVTEFDPASLQFYDQNISDVVPFTGTIVPFSLELNGSGSETISGSAGDDTITLTDSAEGRGGAGDDTMTGEDTAALYGGDGDDVLTIHDRATANGGAGDDVIFASDIFYAGLNATGGAGHDVFATDLRDTADGNTLGISDYQKGVDKLGVMLGDMDLTGVQLLVSESDDPEGFVGTTVNVAGLSDAGNSFGIFYLEGVFDFDANDVVFYRNEIGEVIDIATLGGNDALWGDGNETVNGGAGNDQIVVSDNAVGHGGAGDDTLTAENNAQAFGDEGNDEIRLTDETSGDGGVGDDTLIADGRTSLYGGDGDDVIAGKGTLEGGAGDDRLALGYDQDTRGDHSKSLLYGQADGGDGNDTITAYSGVQEDDVYTTSGSMAIWGGAGDDFIAASGIYAIDAGTGDDTVSVLSDGIGQKQDMTLGAGSDVVLADTARVSSAFYYGISAAITDFNPAEDHLAIIFEEGATAPVATYEWDAVRGGTDVRCEGGVRFFLEGVNHQVTPLSVSYYSSEAALRAGTPYATL